jgi:probable H4MPT-linked C1 transfer pathway protein
MRILGLDIGGANLKAVCFSPKEGRTQAGSRPFALWRHPEQLAEAINALRGELLPPGEDADLSAVTMTGELCDCFATKREGVRAILSAIASPTVVVWRTDGRFVDRAAALADPLPAAAANWLALATFAGRFAPRGPGLLIDIGSTTTDFAPLSDGIPVPVGRTDPDRLRSGELVYTGVRRTPVCALLGGELAAEFFAATQDVYLILGDVPPSPTTDTADGRPATVEAAHARLARMICADLETSTLEEREGLARRVAERQLALLRSALARVLARLPGPPQTVILAGEGEFLAERLLRDVGRAFQPDSADPKSGWKARPTLLRLSDLLGPDVSRAACAHAVAVLAAENERWQVCW